MTAIDEILAVLPAIAARSVGGAFTVEDVVRELRHCGTKYADSTIRTHVMSRMCKDSPRNHAVVYADLERLGGGRYRIANPR
jgi:hypothetical protein